MGDELPIGLTRPLFQRFMRMLRWFESGGGTPPPGRSATAGTPDDNPLITLTGNDTGGGRYTAALLLPIVGTVTPDTNLSLSELGTAAETPAVVALNLPELGKTTHALTVNGTGRVCNSRFLRQEADGTIVVTISEVDFQDGCIESGG